MFFTPWETIRRTDVRNLFLCLLVLTVAIPCVAQAPCGAGAPVPLSDFFDEAADGSLVRQFASDPAALARTEFVTTDPDTGLALHRRYTRLPERDVLVVDSSLSNPGQAPVDVAEVSVVQWQFRVADLLDDGRYSPLAHRNDVWYESTYWTGPNWTRVGKDWHHPGEDTPSVRRFTAPRAGRITVTGRVYKAHTTDGGGDGVRLGIRHGRDTLWEAEIDGDDAEGVEPKLELDVRKGDAVRFVVHKRGKIYCDTTHWDPLVTYADGTRFLASESFASSVKKGDVWSYEMEVDPGDTSRLPVVRALGLDGALTQGSPMVNGPVTCTSGGVAPFVVVSDVKDKSGLAIAFDGNGPWTLDASLSDEGILGIDLRATGEAATSLQPGQSVPLPQVVLTAYEGQWFRGVAAVQDLTDGKTGLASVESVQGVLAAALPADAPSLELWAMVQADWRQQDKLVDTAESYLDAAKTHAAKADALITDLHRQHPEVAFDVERTELGNLKASLEQPPSDLPEARARYLRVRALKRRVALKNPLLDFGPMVFCKRVPTSYSHLVMQYYGWRARPGGGLFVLEEPGRSLATRDVLGEQLPPGNVLEPRLSYDAERIVFSFVESSGKQLDYNKLNNEVDEDFYHVWEVNVDGTGLRQLTSGPYDDLMPTYLPDGGIAFCSTRRRGYARCFGAQFSPRWDTYTLHRSDGDGGNIRTLSFNDVNEWFPTVANTGRILYARWDYIDRDAVTHQNMWATRPDGTNPVAVWGNATPTPHCTFQMQPVPNSSKIVFTASAHHSVAGGPIVVLDPTVGDNGHEPLTRITPEIPFPEAESRDIKEYYTAPWPLSEEYFLVGYSPRPLVWEPGANYRDALGIYLLDAAGNRELLYRDPDIGSTNPCPLVARKRPPVLPSSVDESHSGEVVLADVHRGLGDVPRGHIKWLRIIQIFPKSTPIANTPLIGLAREENGRAVLGTVPVEPDGSARFIIPAQTPLLFQALDENGFAYQTMRSLTYVQPGERVSCVGCHESRMTAPETARAFRREPSQITAGPFDGKPFSYMQVVQPVLDKHCVKCHSGDKPKKGIDLTGAPHEGFVRSYWSLCGDRDFVGAGTNPENAVEAFVPRFGARNQVQRTPPGGMYGALGSRLIKMLRKGHNKVELDDDEFRRLAMWIDCNAIFYGVHEPEGQAVQLAGETVPMPDVQ
jgi:Hydrazine synthase alpha subunit middle domain/WD40-like Beta Propeller Repeat